MGVRLEKAELREGSPEGCDGRFGSVDERRAHVRAEAALESECGLDRSGIGFDEEILEQLVQAFVGGASGGEVIREGEVDEVDDITGDDVGRDADDAHGACCDEREGESIVAREDLEFVR